MPSYLLGAGSLLLLISAFVVTAIFYSTGGCAVVSVSTMNSISSMMCCEPEYQIWAVGVIACVTLSLFAIPQVWDVMMWHGAEGCNQCLLYLQLYTVVFCLVGSFVGGVVVALVTACDNTPFFKLYRVHDLSTAVTFLSQTLLIWLYSGSMLYLVATGRGLAGGLLISAFRAVACLQVAVAWTMSATRSGRWVVAEWLLVTAIILNYGLMQADVLRHERARLGSSPSDEKEPFLKQ